MRSRHGNALRILLLGSALALVPLNTQAQELTLSPQQFRANPSQVLADFPDGGARMIAAIRELTLGDPADLPFIIDLLLKANDAQGTAIGTGLGQAAVAVVKTDQAYAAAIQKAIVDSGSGWTAASGSNPGGGSDKPKVGTAVTVVNQVDGETEKGPQIITSGTEVYADEVVRTGATGKAQVLLADRTNLAINPMTEIRLDKFVYDPSGGAGNVVVVATEGSFRFITGLQAHENYSVKTPFATMGVRGTEFIVVITSDGEQIQVLSGEVTVATVSGQTLSLTAGQVVSVSAFGVPSIPTHSSQPIVNFASLGPPVTNLSFAQALSAFGAVAGGSATGATGSGGPGGGGGGGGAGGGGGPVNGTVTAYSGGGNTGSTPAPNTFVVTTSGDVTLTLSGTVSNGSVSPH